MITQNYINQLTFDVIETTIEVNNILGKDLLESVYHK
ncbi:GxxExxY protein [Flavobacterium indicum]|nr:GxxExxY protein [Flavobacterium indicum]